MDSETLKIILDLKEENALLKRAMLDAAVMLHSRRVHTVAKYGVEEASILFAVIRSTLSSFENKQPTDVLGGISDLMTE